LGGFQLSAQPFHVQPQRGVGARMITGKIGFMENENKELPKHYFVVCYDCQGKDSFSVFERKEFIKYLRGKGWRFRRNAWLGTGWICNDCRNKYIEKWNKDLP
jgi:hypothetical protein